MNEDNVRPVRQLMLRHIQMRALQSDFKAIRKYRTLYPPYDATSTVPNHVFGGLTIAIALQAAFNSLICDEKQKIDKAWETQSVHGTFLGPLKVGSPAHIEVEELRRTRSFQTRLVRIYRSSATSQEHQEKELRAAFLIDFSRNDSPHMRHPVTGDELIFQKPCKRMEVLSLGPEQALTPKEVEARHRGMGAGRKAEQHYLAMFDRCLEMVQLRYPQGHLDIKTFFGFLPLSAEQIRDLPGRGKDATKVTDYLWFKGHPMLNDVETVNAESSSIDGILPIQKHTLGATFAALNLDPRISGVSGSVHHLKHGVDIFSVTLDTTIRFHSHNLHPEAWYLNEVELKAGSNSRYSGEARMFDTRGNLVASCVQNCQLIDLHAERSKKSRSQL